MSEMDKTGVLEYLSQLALKEENIYNVPPTTQVERMAEIVNKALTAPIGCQTPKFTVDSKIGVIFDDITRPTPVDQLLPIVFDYLKNLGATEENIYLIHAPGLHITPESGLTKKVGETYARWPRLIDHDARHSEMEFFGVTSLGTPLWANAIVKEMDFLIGLGTIKPHMDAGFSGGCKIILPGIADKKSIDYNHKLMLSPASKLGRVDGNPVRQDIDEAGKVVGLDFIINVISDSERRVIHAVAGEPIAAYRVGIEKYIKTFATTIPHRFETVIIESAANYLCAVFKTLVIADKILLEKGRLIVFAPNIKAWAPPGSVKRFAVYPENYFYMSSEELAALIATNNVEEVRHATASYNYKRVCEKQTVILVSNYDATSINKMGILAENSLTKLLAETGSSEQQTKDTAVLLNGDHIFPVLG
jgi:nickel-dependent lactate racemase